MPKPQAIPAADHVFRDGMTFKNLRDAIVAASTINMWHVARELATRYRVDNVLCMKCGTPNANPQQHTFFMYRDLSIRICKKCNNGGNALPR